MRQQHLESGGQLSPDLAADAHTTSSNAGRKKNRLILYESTAPATSWPKCPRTPRPGSRPTIGRSSQVPATVEPGPAAVRPVQNRIDSFARRWRDSYPAAVRCLLDGRDNLTVYLRFPREHWNRIRHSNFIERTFGETRRRVKVIGRLPGEHSCTSLVWAVLDRASRGWRGFTMTPAGLRLLHDLRRALFDPPTPLAGAGDPATVTVVRSGTAGQLRPGFRGRPNHRPNHRPWPVALRQRYAILPALRRRAALRPVPPLLWLRVPPGGLPRSPGRLPTHGGTAARAAAPHFPHLHRGLRMSRLRPTSRRRTPLPRLPAVRPPHRRRRKLYRLRGGAHRHGTTRARIDPLFCPTPPLPSSPRGASAPVIYTADWTRPARAVGRLPGRQAGVDRRRQPHQPPSAAAAPAGLRHDLHEGREPSGRTGAARDRRQVRRRSAGHAHAGHGRSAARGRAAGAPRRSRPPAGTAHQPAVALRLSAPLVVRRDPDQTGQEQCAAGEAAERGCPWRGGAARGRDDRRSAFPRRAGQHRGLAARPGR